MTLPLKKLPLHKQHYGRCTRSTSRRRRQEGAPPLIFHGTGTYVQSRRNRPTHQHSAVACGLIHGGQPDSLPSVTVSCRVTQAHSFNERLIHSQLISLPINYASACRLSALSCLDHGLSLTRRGAPPRSSASVRDRETDNATQDGMPDIGRLRLRGKRTCHGEWLRLETGGMGRGGGAPRESVDACCRCAPSFSRSRPPT